MRRKFITGLWTERNVCVRRADTQLLDVKCIRCIRNTSTEVSTKTRVISGFALCTGIKTFTALLSFNQTTDCTKFYICTLHAPNSSSIQFIRQCNSRLLNVNLTRLKVVCAQPSMNTFIFVKRKENSLL